MTVEAFSRADQFLQLLQTDPRGRAICVHLRPSAVPVLFSAGPPPVGGQRLPGQVNRRCAKSKNQISKPDPKCSLANLREFEGVLFRELDPAEDLRALLPHGWPQGLELLVVDADDEEQLRTYVQVSSSGFRGPDEPLSDVLFELSRRGVQHPRCDSFLAVVDGQVAGAGGMETTANVACLFGTSVLPAFRRRGIQAALIARRLDRARARGCHLVTIHTRPGIATERNARRLGFQLAYVKAVMALSAPGLVASP